MSAIICGGTKALVPYASYVCSICTDKGIPLGYEERFEWGFKKIKKEKQLQCPDCGRFAFKEMVKKNHGAASIETNKRRDAFRNQF